jgi:RND family efflux transporter MFP subunit
MRQERSMVRAGNRGARRAGRVGACGSRGDGTRLARGALAVGVAIAIASVALASGPARGDGPAPTSGVLAAYTVAGAPANAARGYDGVVEAIRQTVVAAQVAGAVTAVEVKVGDAVKAGQVLARVDARAAEQGYTASDAQVQAARAALEVAGKEVERQRALYQKRYISEAALDRAEAQYKATRAQVDAQVAQAGAARTQTGFFVLRAPYAGIVSEVPVTQGEMALPGRPLVTLHDPSALRVAVAVPQSAVARDVAAADARVEIPGTTPPGERITPARVTVLPTADPGSHTVTVRLDLPAGTRGATPGMFARAWLPSARTADSGNAQRLFVPVEAVVRRGDLATVYVLDAAGRPLLRQVRLGRTDGARVEILAGVAAGDRVALDPQAAARVPVAGAGAKR